MRKLRQEAVNRLKIAFFCVKTPSFLAWDFFRQRLGGGLSKCTVCPRSNDTFYIVTYYIKWVTTFWIDGNSYVFSYLPNMSSPDVSRSNLKKK